ECTRMGLWIGERLNQMEGQVRFFLPEGGVSALDAPTKPFHDLTARAALFTAIERTVRQTASRQIIKLPHHINAPEFAAALVAAFQSLHGTSRIKRSKAANT
ncbi:MAG: ABC transporter permease, partial [Bosea sp. (in: a-proteobacteria)]